MTTNKPLAIVTGGSGFLGNAISIELINTGWHVISLSRNASQNKDIGSYICDITKEMEVQGAAKNILEKYKEIKAIIHASAPALIRKPILEISAASFEKDIQTTVLGAFFVAQNFIPHMSKRSAFIGITTEAIERSVEKTSPKNLGSYISTKHALRGLLQSLSRETDPEKTRIYGVAPGFLPGGLNRDLPKNVLDFLSTKNGSNVDKTIKVISAICIDPQAYRSGISIDVSADISGGKISPL